jgi:putative hydrolase of the HAD superfamily
MQNQPPAAPDGATKLILFDLDGTLFDHYHSLRCAISAIQDGWPQVASHNRNDLISVYNSALQQAYDKFLSKEITYEETNALKIQLFFAAVGLAEPSLADITRFREIYQPAYRSNRRATPGAVEALVRLRESGHKLIIVSNGQVDDQTAKAKDIGVLHLVDGIVTSEEVGSSKPDPRMFERALGMFASAAPVPHETYMVGDSIDTDIRGGIDAGLRTILFAPVAPDSERDVSGVRVPIIHRMSEILAHFGVAEPRFELSFSHSVDGQKLVIHGLGIDLVTEERHCMCISKEDVRFLAERIGQVPKAVAGKRYISAISMLEGMIRCIAKVAMPINED